MKNLLQLFIGFFKIGIFTFGGGYSMLPMILKEVVEKNKWASEDEVMNYFAIAQCTPGVIAVNLATFIGYKQKKYLGAIVATFGVVLPSLIIITIIASFLKGFMDNPIVDYAFSGIRVAVCALLIKSIFTLFKNSILDYYCFAIFILVLVLSLTIKFSIIYCLVIAGSLGIVIKKTRGVKK